MGNMYTSASLVKDVNNQIADSPNIGFAACRERCYPISSNKFSFNNITVTTVPSYQNHTQMHTSLPNRTSKKLLKGFNRWITALVIITIAITFPFGKSFGQLSVANYATSTNATASLVDMSTGTTTLLAAGSDDASSVVNSIGFNFYFMGTLYTQFSTNSNGALGFGPVAIGTSGTSTGTATLPILHPFGGDAATVTNVAANSKVHFKLTGSSPNRVLVIEWANMKLSFTGYATATAGDGTWQVLLYETTGKIEYIYGAMSIATVFGTAPFIGFSAGSTANLVKNVASATNTFTNVASYTGNTYALGAIANLNSTSNGSRRIYEFTPPTAIPADPTTLTYTAVTTTTTTPNWIDNSSNEAAFLVTRATDAGFTTNVVTTTVASTSTAGTGTSYTAPQTGLTPGTTYFYRVQAITEAQFSTGISSSQATTAGTTYYWVGASPADFNTPANWNTNPAGGGSTRTTATASDILVVDGAGFTPGTAATITLALAGSCGQLLITNNTAVTFQSTTATQRVITINGGAGTDLDVPSGTTLNLTNANPAGFAFSGTGNTASIAGTYNASANTSNVITTTGGTGTLVTITGSVNNSIAGASGCLTGSVATLAFSNGSNYTHSGFTTTAGFVPLATWGASSNITITGGTTSTGGITNPAQTFGNFTYNATSSSATQSVWTTGTTAVIQGNLTITSTGTGIFRALTSGTLTVNGNVIVNGGTFQSASTTGTLNVLGNTTIASGATLNIFGGTYSQRGTTFTNNGTLTGVAATSNLQFFSPTNIAQTFAGTGTVLTNVGILSVQNTNGLTISHTNQIPVLRVNLFQGTVTGSSKITIGTGAALGAAVQIGATGITTAGGSFDAAPTFNLGTGTYSVLYLFETAARSTGFEIPSARSIFAATIGNPNNITVAGGALSIGTLTLQAGNLITSSSNLATITGTATTSTARTTYSSTTASSVGNTVTISSTSGLFVGMNLTVTAGTGSFAPNTVVTSITNGTTFVVSATPTVALSGATVAGVGGWVNGPLAITLPVSLVTGSTYTIPVGKGTYNPFLLVNPTTAAGTSPVIQAEVFDANSGGTPGTLMGSINTSRYWAASLTTAGNFTNTFIRLTDTRGTQDAIANSSTLAGAYNQIGGVTATLAATSITTTAPALTTLGGFYLMGNLGAATLSNLAITPTGNLCTNATRTVSVTVTPGGAPVSTVVINYSINGTAQTAIPMSNSGNDWSGIIPTVTPANGNVTWSVTATDNNNLTATATGTAYADDPLTGSTATANASISTFCAGNTTTSLSATLKRISTGTAAIGTATTVSGSSDVNTAFNNRWPSARTQLLYTAAELQAAGLSAGNITSIAFNINTLGDAATNNNYRVKIGNTALSTLSAFVDTTSGFTNVYNPKTYTHTASGLQTIPFDAPFNWDGTSNIVVQVVMSGADISNNAATFYTATTSNRAAYTAQSETGAAVLSQNRLNIVFAGQISTAIPITSVTWDNGGGTGNPVTVSPTSTTTYTGTITALGCITTASVLVTVNPLPTVPTGNPSFQCGSGVPTVSVSDPNGFTTPTFKWYADNTTITTLQASTSTTYTSSIITTTNFFVSVVNPTTGCESNRTQVTANVVNPDPVSASANGPICLNASLSLTATVTSGTNSNNFLYSWAATPSTGSGIATTVSGGFGSFGTPSTISVTPTAAGTYLYTVTATDGPCTTTSNVSVVINPNPTISSVSANPTTVCAGSPVTLTGTSLNIAAGTPVLGSGTTNLTDATTGTIFPGGYGGAKTQYLIRASELTALGLVAGPITALAFEPTTSGQAYQGFNVSIGHTALTALASPSTTPLVSTGLTQVYVATGTNGGFTPTANVVNTLTFGTGGAANSFTWDGTSNIIVSFCWSSNPTATNSTGTTVKGNAVGFVASATGRSDSQLPSAFCALNSGFGTSTSSSNRPRFTFSGLTSTNIAGNANLVWTWAPGVIGAVATANPVTSPTTTYTPTLLNTTTNCSTTATTGVSITVNAVPDAPNTTFDENNPSTQCGLATPAVAVSNGSNGNYRWYLTPTGGTPITENVTPFNPQVNSTLSNYPISTNTTFYVSIVNDFCESVRTPVYASVTTPDVITASATTLPGYTSGCVDNNITLNAVQTGNNQNYDLTWSTVAPVAGSGLETPVSITYPNSPILVITPTATGTYTYRVDASGGGCNTFSTINVVVNSLPSITSATATPATICAGQSTTLAAASIFSSNYTNLSVGAGALTSTASGTSSVNYASPYSHYYGGYKGQYVVRASELSAAGISAGNINSLAFDVATTSATEFTGFTINLAQSSAAINTTVASSINFLTPTFTQVYTGNTIAGTAGLNTYTFGTGAGSTSSFAWNGTSDIIVQVCWSNNNFGGTAAEVKYDNTTYVSNAFYRADEATPATVCASTVPSGTRSFRPKMVFTGANINNLTSSLTWEWNPGANSGSSVSVLPTSNTDYTVTATNTSTGCVKTSATVAVTVNDLPEQPTVTNNTEQCGPGAPAATVTTGGTNGSGTFNWYAVATGGTALQSSTSLTYTTSISASTTFYVSEVGTNGCESARTQIDVVVNPADELTLTSPAAVCINSTFTLTTTNLGGNNSFDFTYSATPATGSGLATPFVTTDFTKDVTPTVLGTYNYKVVGLDPNSGCTAEATVAVEVKALPVIDSVTASVTTICEGITPVILGGFSSVGTGPQTLPTGYPVSNATNSGDTELLNVSLGTSGSLLNNTSTCATTGAGAANGLPASILNQYSNYTALAATTIIRGDDVPVSVSLGTCSGTFYDRSATVYIDYNRNGVFDLPAEQAFFVTNLFSSATPNTGTISIPNTASLGVTLMRVVLNESTTPTAPNITYSYGETEDYKINIIDPSFNVSNPAYTYTWNPGAVNGSSVTVNPTTNTSYTLTVTDATGCSSTTGTVGNPASIDITVNPVPVAPSGTNSTQCGTGVPTASVTGNGGTFKWYSAATGGILLQTGGTSYTSSINTTTDFYVSETNAFGCEGPRSAVITATVTAPPTIVITPVGATTFCSGSNVVLNAAIGSDPSFTSFTWSSPTSTAGLSATDVAIVTASPTTTTTYVVTGTGGGCSNTATITITVNANPVISSVSATPTTVCSGGASSLVGNILATENFNVGEEANTQTLSVLSGYGMYFTTTNATTINTVDVYPAVAGSLIVQLRNGSTVVDTKTFTIVSGDISTTVAKTLALNFTVPAGTTGWNIYYPSVSIYRGEGSYAYPYTSNGFSISGNTFDGNNITGGSRMYFYNWNVTSTVNQSSSYTWLWSPGALTGSAITVNPTGTNNQVVTYNAVATNPSTGCSSSPSPVSITVLQLDGTATASAAAICVGGTVNLSSTATGGGPFTYSWSNGSSVVGTNATLTASPTTTTTYTLTITDACGNPFSPAPITVTVNPLPTVSVNEASATICAPAVYNLSSTTNAATPAYQWLLGTTSIGGANAPTVTATSTGSYAIRVTDGVTGCINTSTAILVTINPQPATFTITPNAPTVCSGTGVVLTASGGIAAVPSLVNLGTAATTTSANGITPFNSNYEGARIQYLIRASELTALGLTTGNLTSIAFDVTAAGAGTVPQSGYSIKLAHTTSNAMSTTAYSTPVGSFTTCFGPSTVAAPTVGIRTFTFTTPFAWDGTSNVLIDICHDNDITNTCTSCFSGNSTVKYTTTSFNSVFGRYVDNAQACGVNALTALSSGFTNRPNFILGGPVGGPSTFSWTANATLSTTTGAVTTATPISTTTYTAIATSIAGCTNTGSVTVTTTPVTNITTNAAPLSQTLLVNDPSPTPITVAATGTGTVTYAWFSNTTNSSTGGTALGVTTASFTPSSTTLGTRYYYCVASSDCGSATSAVATVVVTNANTWKGGGTTEWTTPSNWSTNQVPTATTDGIIPVGNVPYPILTSSVAVRNLSVDDGAKVTVGANTLTINGAFASSGAGGLSTSSASTITTTGTTDLRFVTGENTVKNLNINSGTATLTNELNVAVGNSPSFGTVTVATGATLNSNGNLVLKSNANGTARVAANNSSNYIAGDVTVERYIPANSKRAWRLLSVPTKGAQTVKQSWQENQQGNTNTTPGFGTFLTANVPAGNLVATGFDFTTPSANMQRYNSASQTWVNITSTNNNATDLMQTNRAYFLYVRGSRAVTPAQSVAASDPTVLRTKGTLYQGTLTAEAVSVGAGKFEPVGNLYASAIDFTGLTRTGGVSSTFYIWDPKAGNSTVLGTYQTFNPLNDYKPFLPGSYGTAVGGADPFRRNTLIESGQGFMVTATGSAGTITLQESAKVVGTGQQVFRPTAGIQKLKTNLYIVNGANTTLADGNLAAFDAAFSNSIDGDDAYKFANPGENFGINRSNTKLVVEARQPVVAKDTVFFDMWNMTSTNYRLEFIPTEMQVPGLTAVLKDKYLGTTTPIDLFAPSVNHDFAIDANAASKDINRFSVIFTQAAGGSLPVNFISLSANRTGAAVKVDWKVASENGIRNYEVQRSTDGRTFNTAGTVTATGNNTSREIAYTWLDAAPFSGTSFYRVKSVGVAGDIKYTNIAKIAGGDVKPGYTISPNPVEGSTVNLTFKNQAQGRYNINLITNDGRVIYTTIAEHAGGNSTQILNLPSFIARGAYQIEIVSPDKKKDVQTLFINTTK